jgi:hypothetical protein
MSSKTKETIEIQKSLYKTQFQKRQAELKTREFEDAKISKDPWLRHLRAKVRQANKKLLAISKIENRMESPVLRKGSKRTKELSEELEEMKPMEKSDSQPSKKKNGMKKRPKPIRTPN